MKIDLQDLSPVRKSMSIEVAAAEVAKETDGVLRAYAKKARVPGFRPGKAPLSVIRARFAKEVKEDVRERILSRSFLDAAREKGLRPLGDPALEDVSHEDGEAFSFKTIFEVLPEFEVKGYKDIEARRPAASVNDEDVDRGLEELRQSRARLVVEEGREAGEGDVAMVDVHGAPAEGEPFDRERMPIEIGAENNLPAFNEHLKGAKAGDIRVFSVDYPDDFQAAELRGRTVEYRLSVAEVKRRELPELDDEFAKDLGDFDDLAALRAGAREDLEAGKKREADQALRQALLDKLLLENPMVLPETLVEQEIRSRMEDIVRGMIVRGMDPKKVEIDWSEMRKRQEEPARKSVHARIVLDAVAQAEKVEVDEAAVEQRILEDAARMGESPQKLREQLQQHHGREALVTQMVREKSLDYLRSVANIQNEE